MLSLVSMTDIHLSLVDTCHVVGTMHLYEYWPPVYFSVTDCKCDKSLNQVETCCVPMSCLYLTSSWVTCDWTVSFSMLSGQVFRVWEHYPVTRWTVGKCTWIWMFARSRRCEKNLTIIHLAPCAMHSCWHICQVRDFWECGFTYWCVWMVMKWVASYHFLTEGLFVLYFCLNVWIHTM
jgi:hypothetical protein